MRVGQRAGLYARPRRPTLDGPAPEVLLHCLHAGGHTPRCHPPCGTPRTFSHRERCFFLYRPVGLTGAGALRVTPHPPPPLTLPKLAGGLSGAPHAAGTPAPCPAAHVEFFFIGLAGLPVSLTPRETPHPAAPPTLPKLAIGLSGAPHAAGHPAPSPAAHVEFFFIGLAGLPAPLTPREIPHLPAPSRCILLIGPFPVTGFLCKTFGAGEGKMRGKRGGKF